MMSSIGRAGSPEDAKSLKATYEAREEKKDKVHEKQLSELQEMHAEEMNKLTLNSKDEAKQIRTQDQIKFTEQDQKHLREIEALKAMYQKKLAERD